VVLVRRNFLSQSAGTEIWNTGVGSWRSTDPFSDNHLTVVRLAMWLASGRPSTVEGEWE
jgi:hypothetical protein